MRDANLLSIPAEVESEMTPAVRAFVQRLLAQLEEFQARLNQTPQNSSLPPCSQHPHAKTPVEKDKIEAETGRSAGTRQARAITDAQCRLRSGSDGQTHRMPAVWSATSRQRPRTVAASSLGTARDQADRHRVSTASAALSAAATSTCAVLPVGRARRVRPGRDWSRWSRC